MKEVFELLKKMDIKAIFINPTKNNILQFIRYVFVGGIATIIDWGILYILTSVYGIYYLISAIVAFIAGLITNFLLAKLFVFKANKVRVNRYIEFISYAIIGIIGLCITEVILYIFTNFMSLHYMISKVIATMIVLFWNYIARKIILYK